MKITQVFRNEKFFLVFLWLTVDVMILGVLLLHAVLTTHTQQTDLADKASLVTRLQLTDLCLFTEARYTRHLSQADLNTAFQDHPLSLEHFPSGSFTQPTLHSDSP